MDVDGTRGLNYWNLLKIRIILFKLGSVQVQWLKNKVLQLLNVIRDTTNFEIYYLYNRPIIYVFTDLITYRYS